MEEKEVDMFMIFFQICHSFILTVVVAGVDVSVWGGPQQAQPQHRSLRPALRGWGQPSQDRGVSSVGFILACKDLGRMSHQLGFLFVLFFVF